MPYCGLRRKYLSNGGKLVLMEAEGDWFCDRLGSFHTVLIFDSYLSF
jgi:hypothetical protein